MHVTQSWALHHSMYDSFQLPICTYLGTVLCITSPQGADVLMLFFFPLENKVNGIPIHPACCKPSRFFVISRSRNGSERGLSDFLLQINFTNPPGHLPLDTYVDPTIPTSVPMHRFHPSLLDRPASPGPAGWHRRQWTVD
jgi:hypothetical protein